MDTGAASSPIAVGPGPEDLVAGLGALWTANKGCDDPSNPCAGQRLGEPRRPRHRRGEDDPARQGAALRHDRRKLRLGDELLQRHAVADRPGDRKRHEQVAAPEGPRRRRRGVRRGLGRGLRERRGVAVRPGNARGDSEDLRRRPGHRGPESERKRDLDGQQRRREHLAHRPVDEQGRPTPSWSAPARGRSRPATPTSGSATSTRDPCSASTTERYLPGLRMGVPNCSAGRSSPPHSSHSTAKTEANGASQAGQRARISPAHCGHRSAARPPNPRSSAARSRSAGRTRPSRRACAGAPPGSSSASRPYRQPRASLPTARRLASKLPDATHRGRFLYGNCARSRADHVAPRDPGGRSRPRGPPRRVPQHAHHARDRGARPHALQAGQDPRLVLHGARQRGRRRRRRHRDGAGRRRHAAAPRHGRPHHARRRAVADLRPVHGPRRRADAAAATATSTWPTRTSG